MMAANFGWNFPPGVSGNEIEIAGADWEGEIERSCDQTDVEIAVLGPESRDLLAANRTGITTTMLVDFVKSMVTVTVPECPFIDGEVYAWSYNGVLTWTCPVCGHEYTEDARDI